MKRSIFGNYSRVHCLESKDYVAKSLFKKKDEFTLFTFNIIHTKQEFTENFLD